MTDICQHCHAKKWPGESKGMCCSGGKIRLDPLQEPPLYLKALLEGNSSDAKHFRNNLWKYNAAFMMTSFGADKNLTYERDGFFTTFKIQGNCYHKMGSLLPPSDEESKYVQVYFINTAD